MYSEGPSFLVYDELTTTSAAFMTMRSQDSPVLVSACHLMDLSPLPKKQEPPLSQKIYNEYPLMVSPFLHVSASRENHSIIPSVPLFQSDRYP